MHDHHTTTDVAARPTDDRSRRRAALPPWPPPLGGAFMRDLLALTADPTQRETGPRAHAPMKQKRTFEDLFAGECRRRFGIAVNSGTTAIDLAVEGLDLAAGGVIVAANYGHPSTIQRAARTHRLRLVDVDAETLCLSPNALAAALAPGDVRLVLMTHVAGHPGRIDVIAGLCESHGVPLIVDASHAHGARFSSGQAGKVGTVACFSLHATKNLSCGEGGILCLDDEALYRRIWRLHDIGREPDAGPYDFTSAGGNFRLSEMAALEARHRMTYMIAHLEQRNAAARQLTASLDESSCLLPLTIADDEQAGWHLFPVWYRPDRCNGLSRKRFLIAMATEGVPCNAGWPKPLSELDWVRPLVESASTPTAARACAEMVWFDGRLLLAADGVERILEGLERVASSARTVGS